MDGSCLNCNKFSHCRNNDLICIYKYREKDQECEELKKTIMYKCPQCGEEYLSPIGASLYEENNKLEQTLAEIKEIAEEEVHTRMLFADKKSFCDFNKILQKISECEVE